MTSTTATTAPANEIAITRVYDAPVKLVWDAWTDPAQVAQWWGPRGFTITTHSKDLRPGGHWNYTMHGPDGVDYPNVTTYFEVEPHKKLVYDHGATPETPALFRVEVTFAETNGKTTMAMRMILPTPEAVAETRAIIKNHNGNSTWDRLAEYLEEEQTSKTMFVINRSFDAPIDRMYDMWTDPQHFAKWLPPVGFTMRFIRADIKPGGTSVFSMTDGKNITMYGRVQYKEMRRPDRIIYTQQFIDEHENISRHPGAPVWPETMLTTVTLAEEDAGQTRVTVQWEPFGNATPEEIAAFAQERSGMTMGWTGSFNKLEDYVNQ